MSDPNSGTRMEVLVVVDPGDGGAPYAVVRAYSPGDTPRDVKVSIAMAHYIISGGLADVEPEPPPVLRTVGRRV